MSQYRKSLTWTSLAGSAFLMFGIAPVQMNGSDQERLPSIESLISLHKASCGLIESTSCKIDLRVRFVDGNGKDAIQSCSAQEWISKGFIRIKVRENGSILDSLWHDSVRRSLHTRGEENGGTEVSALRDSFSSGHIHRCDAWLRGLLVIAPPSDLRGFPLERLITKAEGVPKIETRSHNGRNTIAIILSFPASKDEGRSADWKLEIHLDPAVNYLVSKAVYTAVNSNYQRVEEVVQFKECQPGLYFPEKMIFYSGIDGAKTISGETEISDIRVNQKLSDEIFRFRYPNGIYLTDNIKNTSYKIDSEGNPLSKEVPLSTIPPAPAGKSDAVVPMTETKEEPASSTRWIIPVSLGLIIVAIVLLIRRRIQSKSP